MRGDTADDAIAIGFSARRAGGHAAAAVIMVSVFGGFVLADRPDHQDASGSPSPSGVLVDAFLVRMTFGPAVMSLLGERAWRLPRWLGAGAAAGGRERCEPAGSGRRTRPRTPSRARRPGSGAARAGGVGRRR